MRETICPAAIPPPARPAGPRHSVEESSSCAFTANRTFGFDTADATYTANDTVAAWEGVGSC